MRAPVDVLAVLDRLIADAQKTPQPGIYYPTPWARLWDNGLEKPARKGSYTVLLRNEHGGSGELGPMTRKQAEAKAAELNGFGAARAAVDELVKVAKRMDRIARMTDDGESDYIEVQRDHLDALTAALAKVAP
jgi:hypothetical protein